MPGRALWWCRELGQDSRPHVSPGLGILVGAPTPGAALGWNWAYTALGRGGWALGVRVGQAGLSQTGEARGRPLNHQPTENLCRKSPLKPGASWLMYPSLHPRLWGRCKAGFRDWGLQILQPQKRSHTMITDVPKLLLPLRSEQFRKLAQLHPHPRAPFLTATVRDVRIQAPSALTHSFSKYLLSA